MRAAAVVSSHSPRSTCPPRARPVRMPARPLSLHPPSDHSCDMTRFWLACALFHILLCLVGWLLARRWTGRLKKRSPWGLWAVQVVADFFLLGWGALLLALVCSAIFGRTSSFTVVRFLAQALFVEAPVYC